MSARRAACVIVVGAVTLALTSCKPAAGGKEDTPAKGATGKGGRGGGGANVAFAVDAIRATAKKLDYLVTAPGTIEAFERVQVTARVAGAVDRVSFSEGQEVKQGGVLVSIDSERYMRAVNSARAAYEKTQAAQKDMEASVARREGASDQHPGLIPGEELASFRTKALTAKADTAVALEALKLAELNLRDSSVRAPISGVIQTRTVETGQYVQTGYVMATLLRSEPMLLRFEVEPQEAPRIKPGMTASFTMRETQRSFAARVTLVAGAADPTTHMVPVTGEVVDDGHKYWLRPGSFCDVTIDVGASRDAVVVPRMATRATDKGTIAYVVDGDVATPRTVTVGMSSRDGWVEIRSGLKDGELVVIRGAEALSPGARVRMTVVDSPDAAAPRPAASDAAPAASGSAGGGRRRKNVEAAPPAAASAGAP